MGLTSELDSYAELNGIGIKTAWGKRWTAQAVKNEFFSPINIQLRKVIIRGTHAIFCNLDLVAFRFCNIS